MTGSARTVRFFNPERIAEDPAVAIAADEALIAEDRAAEDDLVQSSIAEDYVVVGRNRERNREFTLYVSRPIVARLERSGLMSRYLDMRHRKVPA